jgi:ArsR family transcriptional regulator, zinc-responsive transcriptional repressor
MWEKVPMTTASISSVKAKVKSAKAKKDAEQRVKHAKQAAILLKQISDATRLQVILILSEGERHVGGLCEELNQSQPAVSHHLALLRHGGIVTVRRQGKNNFYALAETGEELAEVIRGLMA